MAMSLPRLAFVAMASAMTGPAAAQEPSANMVTAGYQGNLGASRIGMTLFVRDGKLVPDSHYFRQTDLADIPLAGEVGSELVMREPGGGTFSLRFKDNGDDGRGPTLLDDSVDLQGTWTGPDGQSHPVTLQGGAPVPAEPPGTHWYRSITDLSDEAFEAKVQGFYRAVMAGDRAGAARYVGFPLEIVVNPAESAFIETSDELDARWEEIFTPAWLQRAAVAMPHDMAIENDMAVLGDGLAYFDEDGAALINAAN
ncbi:hypothetical protein KXR53_32800 [Inquilinus limosus]|uniref:hypothetical protein n=1 Tax=Inquilinus limosus TaxID=171674 RepID=UPI003F1907B4